MGCNNYLPHVLVLPEDDVNAGLADGFQLKLNPREMRQMDVLPVAGGWMKVLNDFRSDHISNMRANSNRNMVLIIDFDGHSDRLETAQDSIPEDLRDRVFVLGSLANPEALTQAGLGTYEEIGSKLAQDCREETDTTWGHQLLRHNESELIRLRQRVRPILFPSA